jgi:hypothetical protein
VAPVRRAAGAVPLSAVTGEEEPGRAPELGARVGVGTLTGALGGAGTGTVGVLGAGGVLSLTGGGVTWTGGGGAGTSRTGGDGRRTVGGLRTGGGAG